MGALNFDPAAVLANFEKRRAGPAKTANPLKYEGRLRSFSEFSRGVPEKSKSDDAELATGRTQDGRSVAPVSISPDTPYLPSGDSVASQRATITNHGALEERASLVEYGAGVPREWAAGFARLDLASPPKGFHKDRWRTLIDDGSKFLNRWGSEAARLGWSALDVFGIHPIAPGARFDAAGLVVLICGGEVISIKPDLATIRAKGSGSLLTYLRSPRAGVVALWDVAMRHFEYPRRTQVSPHSHTEPVH